MLKRRVVVTGLGMVSPLGTGVEKTWNALIQGKSGVGRITKFDSTGFDTQIAAEVKDFTPENFIEKKEIRRMDIFIQYAIAGARWPWMIPSSRSRLKMRNGSEWSWERVWEG